MSPKTKCTGVKLCEHEFYHWRVLGRVHAKRNTAAIVLHRDGFIQVNNHFDFFAVTGQGFICRVVQNLLNDVHRVVGAGVHAGALLDRLQALQDADGAFRIFSVGFDRHSDAL